ncbi:hypothetical protein [Methylobacterium sp. CM6247]
MTPSEQAAYARGVQEAREMALIAAVTIEARDDHREAIITEAWTDLAGWRL